MKTNSCVPNPDTCTMDQLCLSAATLSAAWETRKHELYEDAMVSLIEHNLLHDCGDIRTKILDACKTASSKNDLGVDVWWITDTPTHETRLHIRRDDTDILPPISAATILHDTYICERLMVSLKVDRAYFGVTLHRTQHGDAVTHTVRLEFFPNKMSDEFLAMLDGFAKKDAARTHLDTSDLWIYVH